MNKICVNRNRCESNFKVMIKMFINYQYRISVENTHKESIKIQKRKSEKYKNNNQQNKKSAFHFFFIIIHIDRAGRSLN